MCTGRVYKPQVDCGKVYFGLLHPLGTRTAFTAGKRGWNFDILVGCYQYVFQH